MKWREGVALSIGKAYVWTEMDRDLRLSASTA